MLKQISVIENRDYFFFISHSIYWQQHALIKKPDWTLHNYINLWLSPSEGTVFLNLTRQHYRKYVHEREDNIKLSA